ncbi:MAG: VWA domain-containing protein [Deltaproteobacteria bacterium]|nr:VWA domain-containing protein [Deltaproteobacteria bacterium]
MQYLKYDAGTMSLAFPMVVGPRYVPGASCAPDGSVTPLPGVPQSVPDADRITPPVLRPGERSGHDVALAVKLSAGVPFRGLRSKSHQVVTTQIDASNAIVRLSPEDSIPNKDFVLEWDVDPQRVATGLLTHASAGDGGFLTLMMVPAARPAPADVTPKEMVFVLDCSGSMSGNPIEQAKRLVRHSLKALNPGDSFQILNFSMSARGMSPLPVPNTPDNVRRGLAYLDTLQGEGGTEMLTGIRAALDFPPDPERLRVVMFLTDGYIGNETQILAAIRERIGEARLYAFGVGSSVNRYLLENMALEGRGTVQYVRYDEDAGTPIERFYDQVRSPLLTDVEIDWGGLDVREVLPARAGRVRGASAARDRAVRGAGHRDGPGEGPDRRRGRGAAGRGRAAGGRAAQHRAPDALGAPRDRRPGAPDAERGAGAAGAGRDRPVRALPGPVPVHGVRGDRGEGPHERARRPRQGGGPGRAAGRRVVGRRVRGRRGRRRGRRSRRERRVGQGGGADAGAGSRERSGPGRPGRRRSGIRPRSGRNALRGGAAAVPETGSRHGRLRRDRVPLRAHDAAVGRRGRGAGRRPPR